VESGAMSDMGAPLRFFRGKDRRGKCEGLSLALPFVSALRHRFVQGATDAAPQAGNLHAVLSFKACRAAMLALWCGLAHPCRKPGSARAMALASLPLPIPGTPQHRRIHSRRRPFQSIAVRKPPPVHIPRIHRHRPGRTHGSGDGGILTREGAMRRLRLPRVEFLSANGKGDLAAGSIRRDRRMWNWPRRARRGHVPTSA
jgi:hypothetical protein